MAYCENCGHEVSEQATACPQCGHPQRVAAAGMTGSAAMPAARRTDGTAIAALILGILGLFGCFVFSILAIVFGNQARDKIARDPSLDGEGLARAGVITGWVGIGLGAIWVLVWLAAVGTSATF